MGDKNALQCLSTCALRMSSFQIEEDALYLTHSTSDARSLVPLRHAQNQGALPQRHRVEERSPHPNYDQVFSPHSLHDEVQRRHALSRGVRFQAQAVARLMHTATHGTGRTAQYTATFAIEGGLRSPIYTGTLEGGLCTLRYRSTRRVLDPDLQML